jgi:putative acetyltransferase
MIGIDVRREDIGAPIAAKLITALNAELAAEYNDPRANHFRLDADEVTPGRGAFVVAYVGAEAVGCGAIRRIDDGTAEIKRMYVAPEWRGRGVGRRLLEALEDEARRLAVGRVVLETGVRQTRALALYRDFGFDGIPAYGEYVNTPETSVCMAKDVSPFAVREAIDADAAAIAALANELGYPSTEDQIRARLAFVRRAAGDTVLVALRGDNVAGWIHLSVMASVESDAFAEIRGLVVTEKERGTGAGTRLVGAAEAWARRRSCPRLRVRSNIVRDETRRFYENRGFAVVKTQNVFDKVLS